MVFTTGRIYMIWVMITFIHLSLASLPIFGHIFVLFYLLFVFDMYNNFFFFLFKKKSQSEQLDVIVCEYQFLLLHSWLLTLWKLFLILFYRYKNTWAP